MWPSYSWNFTAQPMRIWKFYDLPLPSWFPPTEHKSFNGITNNWGGNSVWFTPLVTDLSPRRTLRVKVSNLIAAIHQVKQSGGLCVTGPPVLTDIPIWLWLPVYVSGTLQWINFAAVGHHLGLSYSLYSTLPEPPLHFFFFFRNAKWLCPCKDLSNPRGTACRSQGVLSIYIWMMSAEIFRWYLTSRLPTQSFSEFHSVAEPSTWKECSPQYLLFRLS